VRVRDDISRIFSGDRLPWESEAVPHAPRNFTRGPRRFYISRGLERETPLFFFRCFFRGRMLHPGPYGFRCFSVFLPALLALFLCWDVSPCRLSSAFSVFLHRSTVCLSAILGALCRLSACGPSSSTDARITFFFFPNQRIVARSNGIVASSEDDFVRNAAYPAFLDNHGTNFCSMQNSTRICLVEFVFFSRARAYKIVMNSRTRTHLEIGSLRTRSLLFNN
jgi:hypothetical protein